jgi:hypothetical protein
MRPLPLIVHVQSEKDASCIAEALTEWGTSVEHTGSDSNWDVNVKSTSLAIGELISVLHKCLADNDIPHVSVTIDGRTYMNVRPA